MHSFFIYSLLELSILLTQGIQTVTYNLLEFELGTIYKLSYSKVFWAHLVDTELLLLVDIACDDGLDERYSP